MRKSDLFTLVVIAGIVYVAWRYFKSGVQTLVTPGATAVANTWVYVQSAWDNMTLFPSMSVLGNALMPDGSLIPMSQVTLKGDSAGNLFGTYGGHTYQFAPSNVAGNFPATLLN
jgi:hypothetical protein